jgi:hypothetical protein
LSLVKLAKFFQWVDAFGSSIGRGFLLGWKVAYHLGFSFSPFLN